MKYTTETYDQLIQRSYGYSVKEQASWDWKLMRYLYEKYYLNTDGDAVIPKVIHQIWIGGDVPKVYIPFMESWKTHHPDWTYKFWDEGDADRMLANNPVYQRSNNNGMKSDILRYAILQQEGGIYIDTDFECLHPLDDLMYLKFFTGLSYDAKLVFYIGLIGSVPNHPIMRYCVDEAKIYPGDNAMVIMDSSGNYHFTRSFLKGVMEDQDKVVAFPMDFFYPLPNNQRNTNDPYAFIRPCSYAIHHWAVSWIVK